MDANAITNEKSKIMDNQDIKTKPPKKATNIDTDGIYWLISSQDKPQAYLYNEWTYCEPKTSLRSLADIRRIIELEDLLKLIKKDLLMRANEDDDGTKVVDLSSSIWIKINSLLE